MQKNVYDPETGSRSGATHVPSKPSAIPSPRTMPCRDSGLPHDTWTSGIVFERLRARERRTSTVFDDSKILASSSCGFGPGHTGNVLEHGREVRREPLSSSIFVPGFRRGAGVYDHTGGTYSHSGMIDYPRFPIFLDSRKLQSWKVNFKTELCSKTADLHLPMHWTKEVDMAKPIDEPLTSRSIVARNDFSNYDMLVAMTASALKGLLDTHVHLNTRESVEEQRAQKIRPLLERKTNCLHDLRAFPCNWSL